MKSFIVAVAVVVAGCASPPMSVAARDYIVSHAGSPYQLGTLDGCASGESAAGNPWKRFSKDPQRYLSDAMYKQGWDDGFAQCKGQYEAIGRALER